MKHKLRIFFWAAVAIGIVVNYFAGAHAGGRSDVVPSEVGAADYADTIPIDSLPYAERLRLRLDSLCTGEFFIQTQLGLMVYDLDAGRVLYALGEKQLLRPASTLKLLTAITALDRLGSNYQYRTELYFSGDCGMNALYGDIYIKGTMDPTLEKADIERLVESITALQTDTIHGNIVADRSFMDSPPLGRGWCWDDDNPALTPLVYQRKDNITEVLRQCMTEHDIVVTGNNTTGTTPEDAVLLAERHTPLTAVLMTMLKESDNLYAESVLYNLGGSTRLPATADAAIAHERALIRRTGLNPDDYELADGSGLSPYNYLSAECEVFLLRYAYHDARIFPSLYRALPKAGTDGTLKWRMQNTLAEDNVRAKTGTLTGVSTLAGYCFSPEGHMLAFAILNQGVIGRRRAHAFQDAVCVALCK
ncbi:MAG: D-alanyl-D-alanine carboxypeptidase/D-alanyl-D-alanine-endopeptidase [Prevotella sp.]|nr:D-alanyl-D-alanine carboxypeptidase/D-alanyl-D-alanine-endopeptidase [Prevotella sp.]